MTLFDNIEDCTSIIPEPQTFTNKKNKTEKIQVFNQHFIYYFFLSRISNTRTNNGFQQIMNDIKLDKGILSNEDQNKTTDEIVDYFKNNNNNAHKAINNNDNGK